jgi:DNA polymerase-3 subunit delta
VLSLFYGDAEILKQQAAHKIIDAWLDEGDREYGLVTLSGSEGDVGAIAGEVNGISLLAPRKVIVVRKVDGFSNSQQKALAATLAHVPGDVRVVMLADVDSDSRSRSTAPVAADLRKIVEKAGQIIPFMTPYERELGGWVVEEASQVGKKMAPPVGQALVETVGADMDRLHQEVAKLATYVGGHHQITLEDVKAVACRSADTDVFALVDAIGKRDTRAALDMLPLFLPVGAPSGAALQILAMISRQLRLIWQARMVIEAGLRLEDLRDTPPALTGMLPENQHIISSVKGRRFLATKYTQQARNFSDETLARAIEAVYLTDLALKGQTEEQMDDRMAMELLLVSLCTG